MSIDPGESGEELQEALAARRLQATWDAVLADERRTG
jgi:hypothetical protein